MITNEKLKEYKRLARKERRQTIIEAIKNVWYLTIDIWHYRIQGLKKPENRKN